MTSDLAVDVRGLRKSYGNQTVLDGVDLAVRAGTVTALLGPNGAGKTTTVGILSTLLRLDGGSARVAGYDIVAQPEKVRAAIGVTGQMSAVDDLLTGVENLRLMASLHHLGRREGRERVDALLTRFGLTDAARKPVSTWSGGMRRKLDLAMTLVGAPAVVFLDEPTAGLDPRSRRSLWDEVRALVAGGTTILLTTQYLEEADKLADRVAVLDRGRIVAEGTPAELKSAHDAGSLDDVFLRLTEPTSDLESARGVHRAVRRRQAGTWTGTGPAGSPSPRAWTETRAGRCTSPGSSHWSRTSPDAAESRTAACDGAWPGTRSCRRARSRRGHRCGGFELRGRWFLQRTRAHRLLRRRPPGLHRLPDAQLTTEDEEPVDGALPRFREVPSFHTDGPSATKEKPPMEEIARRPLGRTGLLVSEICLGTSPLASMPELYGYAVDDARAEATIEAALASPVNFIDTSNNYGGGSAETRIGHVLQRHGGLPQGVVLATKVDADQTTRDFSGDRVMRSAEESLTRLGLDRIQLMYLHDPEFYLTFDEAMAPGGAVEGLRALRDSGVVEHIGVAAGDVALMRQLVATDEFDVVLNHNRYTLVDRSAEPLIDDAIARGVAFVNAAPYGGGILSKGPGARSTYGYRDADGVVLERVRAMQAACDRHGVPLAAAALQFSLREPRVTSTVVGVSSPERIAETVALAQLSVPVELWDELAALTPPAEHWLP